jgi:hypothetical protein
MGDPFYRYYPAKLQAWAFKALNMFVSNNLTVSGNILEASIPSIQTFSIAENLAGPFVYGDPLGTSFSVAGGSKDIKMQLHLAIDLQTTHKDQYTIPFTIEKYNGVSWVVYESFDLIYHFSMKDEHFNLVRLYSTTLDPGFSYRLVYDYSDVYIVSHSDCHCNINVLLLGPV